jgi:hypothetical protein
MNRLLYGIYRANKVEGTIKLHKATGTRTLATFTATLESAVLSRNP